MTIVLGCLLGAGLILLVSPRLWPATVGRTERRRSRLVAGVRDRITQAGLPSVGIATVVAVSAVLGLAASALTFALAPVLALAAAVGLIAAAVPAIVIESRARARHRANRAVWPDLVDHLVSGVRSGLALPDSVV
ncbi:MAG: hypothetical protein RI885_2224, partial [Actinomycetota bacterium]